MKSPYYSKNLETGTVPGYLEKLLRSFSSP
jgi:hypothetical protein